MQREVSERTHRAPRRRSGAARGGSSSESQRSRSAPNGAQSRRAPSPGDEALQQMGAPSPWLPALSVALGLPERASAWRNPRTSATSPRRGKRSGAALSHAKGGGPTRRRGRERRAQPPRTREAPTAARRRRWRRTARRSPRSRRTRRAWPPSGFSCGFAGTRRLRRQRPTPPSARCPTTILAQLPHLPHLGAPASIRSVRSALVMCERACPAPARPPIRFGAHAPATATSRRRPA